MTEHEKVYVICENMCLEEGMTKEQSHETFQTKTDADSTRVNLQNQINGLASGSPKGTYASTEALINANPSTGVYIVSSNGHIYSWVKDGSTAIDLGVYQSTGIGAQEVKPYNVTFLDLDYQANLFEDRFIELKGSYYDQNGSKQYADSIYSYRYTKEIIEANNKNLCTNGTVGLTLWNEDNTFVAGTNIAGSYNFKTFLNNNPNYSYVRAWKYKNGTNYLAYSYLESNANKYILPTNISVFAENIKSFNSSIIPNNSVPYTKTNYLKISKMGNLLCEDFKEYTGRFYDLNGVSNTNEAFSVYCYSKEYLENDSYYPMSNLYLIQDSSNVYKFLSATLWNQAGEFVASINNAGGNTHLKDLLNNNEFDFIRVSVNNAGVTNKRLYFGYNNVPNYNSYLELNDLIIKEDNVVSSKLDGKSLIFFGDSWTAPNTEKEYTFYDYVKLKNPNCTVKGCGRNGADWAQGYSYWFGNQENYATIDQNYDYVIVQAYTNGLYVNEENLTKQLGQINEFTYYSSLEDIATAYGDTYAKDLETFIYTIVNKWKGNKIGVMFPFKSVNMMAETNAFRVFREQVFKVCRKYNIPVLDLFDSSGIPTFTQTDIDTYFFKNGAAHGDGCHLNSAGMALINPRIEQWIRDM